MSPTNKVTICMQGEGLEELIVDDEFEALMDDVADKDPASSSNFVPQEFVPHLAQIYMFAQTLYGEDAVEEMKAVKIIESEYMNMTYHTIHDLSQHLKRSLIDELMAAPLPRINEEDGEIKGLSEFLEGDEELTEEKVLGKRTPEDEQPKQVFKDYRVYDGSKITIAAEVPAKGILPSTGETITYTKVLAEIDGQYRYFAAASDRDPRSKRVLTTSFFSARKKYTVEKKEDLEERLLILTDNAIIHSGRYLYEIEEDIKSLGGRIHLNTFDDGGMGETCVTFNPFANRLEVLKRAKDEGNPMDKYRLEAALLNESRMLNLFNDHREIINIFSTEVIDDKLTIVTPYAQMNTYQLVDAARKKYESGEDKEAMNKMFFHVLSEMQKAIRILHDKGVMYLDFKPDNVLWTWNGSDMPYISLIDFGSALRYKESRANPFLTFTPETVEPQMLLPYVAAMNMIPSIYDINDSSPPDEQINHEDMIAIGNMAALNGARLDYEDASDMYALGATLERIVAYALDIELREPDIEEGTEGEMGHIPLKYIFEKTLYDQANITNLQYTNSKIKEKEDRSKPFSNVVFDVIKRLKSSRESRPSIDDFAVIDRGDYNYWVTWGLKTVNYGRGIDTSDEDNKIFYRLDCDDEDINYTLARRIQEITQGFKMLEEQNGWVYGSVAYDPDNQSVVLDHLMNINTAKRFTWNNDEELILNGNAEPEQLLTFEIPALAPSEIYAYWKTGEEKQKPYWDSEKRFDIEVEAKIYEIAMAMIDHIGQKLGVADKHSLDSTELSGLIGMYQGYMLNHRGKGFPERIKEQNTAAALHIAHIKKYLAVKKANDEHKLVSPEVMGLLHSMLQSRKNRPTIDKIIYSAKELMQQYRTK